MTAVPYIEGAHEHHVSNGPPARRRDRRAVPPRRLRRRSRPAHRGRARALPRSGDRRRAATDARGDMRRLAEKSRYQQSFLQCMNLWEDRPDVRPLTFHPRLGQAAAELLGSTPCGSGTTRRSTSRRAAAPPTPTRTTRTGRSRRRHRSPRGSPSRARRWRPAPWATCPGTPPHRAAQVRQHLLRRARGHPRRPRGRAASSRSSSRCRRGSVAFHHGLTVHLAEPNTHRPRPRRCTRSSTSPTAAPAATRPALRRRSRRHRGRRPDRQRRHARSSGPARRATCHRLREARSRSWATSPIQEPSRARIDRRRLIRRRREADAHHRPRYTVGIWRQRL